MGYDPGDEQPEKPEPEVPSVGNQHTDPLFGEKPAPPPAKEGAD